MQVIRINKRGRNIFLYCSEKKQMNGPNLNSYTEPYNAAELYELHSSECHLRLSGCMLSILCACRRDTDSTGRGCLLYSIISAHRHIAQRVGQVFALYGGNAGGFI